MRDDQLRLIFTCCHPALRVEHQIALTLRLIAGLSPQEVARAFLVSESTMAKRLVRAKFKISAAGIPFRVPDAAELPARLRAVLAVLYLIYNAGADNREGRGDLRREAIRLARLLVTVTPTNPKRSACSRSCCCAKPGHRHAAPTPSFSCATRTGRSGTAG